MPHANTGQKFTPPDDGFRRQKGEISTCSGANLSFSFIQFCLARKEDQGFERKMIRGEGAQAFSREWSQMLDCRRCWTAEMQVFTCTS